MKNRLFQIIYAWLLPGLCILSAGAFLSSCEDTEEAKPSELYSISFASRSVNVAREYTKVLTPVFKDPGAEKLSYRWVSTNPDVAAVVKNSDGTATVTGVSLGSAIVRIVCTTDPSLYASCSISVFNYIVDLDKTTGSVAKNETMTLTPSFTGEGYENLEFRWSSSDPQIATVVENSDGTATVTALTVGNTDVTIECVSDPAVKATCSVEVYAYHIALDKTDVNIAKGETMLLTPSYTGAGAENLAYVWTSSNENVATVATNTDGTVTVTAIGTGDAVISVTYADDATVTASCNVTVLPNTLTIDQSAVSLRKGATLLITPTVGGEGASSLTFTWSSSDPAVAVVTSGADNKATVTGLAPGTATITITCDQFPALTAVCEVEIVIYTVTLDKSAATVGAGSQIVLNPSYAPDAARDLSYNWSSSDPTVATVIKNANGTATVTAVAQGVATITVTSTVDIDITASLALTVNPALGADKIFLDGTAIGTKTQVSATLENKYKYAWLGNLNAGQLTIPVEFESANWHFGSVEGDGTLQDGQPETIEMKSSAFTWNIPAAGEYRVVVDLSSKTVIIYSPETNLKPAVVEWTHPTNGPTPTTVNTLYYYGNNRWNWNGPATGDFTQSLADPQVFVYYVTTGTGLSGRTKFGVAQHDNCYVYTGPDTGNGVPQISHGVTYDMMSGTTVRNNYFNLANNTRFIIIDIRNLTMVTYTAAP